MEDLTLKLTNLSPTLFLDSRPDAYRSFSQGNKDEPNLSNPTSITDEINFKKELFSKLKFQYLEQETREKFLRAILENPPLYVEKQDIDTKIDTNAELKRDLKQLKQKQQQLELELRDLALDVLEMYEVFQGKTRATELMLEEIEVMEQELKGIAESNGVVAEFVKFESENDRENVHSNDKNGINEDDDTVVEYSRHGIANKLSKTMESENKKLSRLDSELGLRQELMESHKQTIEKLNSKLIQLEDQVEVTQRANSGESKTLSEDQIYVQWVKEMTLAWHNLYGEEIDIEVTQEQHGKRIVGKSAGKVVRVNVVDRNGSGDLVLQDDNGRELGREFSSLKGYEKVAKVILELLGK